MKNFYKYIAFETWIFPGSSTFFFVLREQMFFSQKIVGLLFFLPELNFDWNWYQDNLDDLTYQVKKTSWI